VTDNQDKGVCEWRCYNNITMWWGSCEAAEPWYKTRPDFCPYCGRPVRGVEKEKP